MSSMKYHLKEMVEITAFTFKELGTLLTQVQACLNSCSLTALFNDPNDLTYLSPGNFLISAPLTSFPQPSLFELSVVYVAALATDPTTFLEEVIHRLS